MSLPEIIYEGSVKNVRGEEGVSPYIFEFSDRYSIFDWGQMPDLLIGKGESLAFLAWFFFDYLGKSATWSGWNAPSKYQGSLALRDLCAHGMRHHAQALVGGDLNPMSIEREIMSPSRLLAVTPVAVHMPPSSQQDGKLVWDYSAYKTKPENALVPLEVIFRFGVPEGSSLLKRTGDAAYCHDIGLTAPPVTGDRFADPVIEMSTKLENKDRYIDSAEARGIAGISDQEWQRLRDYAALLALRLRDCFSGIGVELWDGKFEFAFTAADETGARGFMLVDSIGPDELRLMADGVHLSKETLRGAYRGSAWLVALEKAKTLADERGEKDWKKICAEELGAKPSLLPPSLKEKTEMIYRGLSRALAEKYLGKTIFADAWDLAAVIAAFAPKKDKQVA